MGDLNSKSGTVTNKSKSKNVKRVQKLKSTASLIDYGDPDSKVAVRLLPPTLEEHDFLEQAKESSPILRAGCKSFTYIKGRRPVQAFEEPTFSLALLKFSSSEAAETFKKEISSLSFTEKETGDSTKCHTLKPIIGELYTAILSTADAKSVDNDVFKAFSELRETNGGQVDIVEAMTAAKALLKQRKTKLKHQKKKPGKEKVIDARNLPHNTVPVRPESGPKATKKHSIESRVHEPKIQKVDTGESRKDTKPKKKINRKSKNVKQSETNLQSPTQNPVAVTPKTSRKPPKKKKKKAEVETSAVITSTEK